MAKVNPSLLDFERLVRERQYPQAYWQALAILDAIDHRYGKLDTIDAGDIDRGQPGEEAARIFCTRFAAALGRLFSEPDWSFSTLGFESLVMHHRWIDSIFSVSGFGTSDHLLPVIANRNNDGIWTFDGANIMRLLTILSLDSRHSINLQQCWDANASAAAVAFLLYISSRYVYAPRAFEFRERLLEWLPDKLDSVRLGTAVLAKVTEIYMHTSYAVTRNKHAIKAGLLRQLRQTCLEHGCVEWSPDGAEPPAGRPTVVVVCEHFAVGHSMYRTHSLAVRSLRERFHVVGIAMGAQISPGVENIFDELIPVPGKKAFEGIRTLADEIRRRSPVLVLYPSVGMTPYAIALASLRLAPIQCASFGHAASTMSPAIDYMILPEDFVGSPDRYSETLVPLPARAMPFLPYPGSERPSRERAPGGPVRVAIPAAVMKVNPHLLDTLRAISSAARTRVEFVFLPLAATGIAQMMLAKGVKAFLPSAVVHFHAPFDQYMKNMAQCDLFLSPFPYGNTNSLIDAINCGLPGVCLDGPEPHAHIDAALMTRLKLPAALIAHTRDEYIAAAVRLIDDADWREHCRALVADCDMDAAIHRGDASLFCRAIEQLVDERFPGLMPQSAGAMT